MVVARKQTSLEYWSCPPYISSSHDTVIKRISWWNFWTSQLLWTSWPKDVSTTLHHSLIPYSRSCVPPRVSVTGAQSSNILDSSKMLRPDNHWLSQKIHELTCHLMTDSYSDLTLSCTNIRYGEEWSDWWFLLVSQIVDKGILKSYFDSLHIRDDNIIGFIEFSSNSFSCTSQSSRTYYRMFSLYYFFRARFVIDSVSKIFDWLIEDCEKSSKFWVNENHMKSEVIEISFVQILSFFIFNSYVIYIKYIYIYITLLLWLRIAIKICRPFFLPLFFRITSFLSTWYPSIWTYSFTIFFSFELEIRIAYL